MLVATEVNDLVRGSKIGGVYSEDLGIVGEYHPGHSINLRK
jgi:hypothetical protein